jgi:ligand-binding sensor domain-containing protein
MDWNRWGGGLAKFDGVNWTVYNTSNSGLPDNYVYAIAIDGQGNKWIGTGVEVLQSLME